jgi:hypothetical protein
MALEYYMLGRLRVFRQSGGLEDVLYCIAWYCIHHQYLLLLILVTLESLTTHSFFLFLLVSLSTTTTISTATTDVRHGTGMKTGIHLEALVDAGDYVCQILKRDNQSKVARAILAKRRAAGQ